MLKGSKSIVGTVLALSSLIMLATASLSEDQVHDYDWKVTLETEELKDVLNYNGSKMKNPVKVHVTLLESGKPDDEAISYEDFWYVEGKPYGQEKHCKLSIPPGKAIAFRVKHKDQTVVEKHNAAAANAIARVLVDTYNDGIMLTAIKVPPDSLNSIVNHLQELNFTPANENSPEQASQSKVTLYVVSETDSSNGQTLEYLN